MILCTVFLHSNATFWCFPTTRITWVCAQFRALQDPGDKGQGVGRVGGRTRTGTGVRKPKGRPGPEGCGRAERPRKYSSVHREGSGTRTVVQGKGGGGGSERRSPRKL